MTKYLYNFKLNFLSTFKYRFNTLVSLVFSNVRLIVIIFFWVLIYGGDTHRTFNGFSLHGIITYMIIMDVIGTLAFCLRNAGFDYSGMIKSGSLGPALIKPRSLSAQIYFRNLAIGVTSMIPQAALVLCVLPFISRVMVWKIDAPGAAFILLFLAVGTVSSHLLCSALGYMAFWLEEANAVMWSFAVLLNMAMGFFIPLDFFPKWSVPVLEMMPVSSWGYIQTKIYIGLYSAEKLTFLLIVQILWIGALLLVNAAVWKSGVKKFTSVGG